MSTRRPALLPLLFMLSAAMPLAAQPLTQQPEFIVFDQQSTVDNIQQLVPQNAARSPSLVVDNLGGVALGYVSNFRDTDQRIVWSVGLGAGDAYQAWLLAEIPNGVVVNVSVNDVVVGSVIGNGVNKYLVTGMNGAAAQLPLNAGTNRISLGLPAAADAGVRVRAMEVLRSRDVPAYQNRVAAFRAAAATTRDAWSKAKYGVMFQWGHWGVPSNVGQSKDINTLADDFDVPTFIQKLVNTGAKSLIWSITWRDSTMLAPLNAESTIIRAAGGDATGMNSRRDLIGEIAAAAKAKGISFGLYVHPGWEDRNWWPVQRFPESTFGSQGIGDRTTFLNNWKAVVTEIGQRYGSNLDAFFFDNANAYFPARFEDLSATARTGNPARLVSFNSWINPRMTDFQDVSFGEGQWGARDAYTAQLGGNGVYRGGPHDGLLQQGMYLMDGVDWGLWAGHRNIVPAPMSFTDNMVYNVTNPASGGASYGVPVIYDIQMYEDGTVAEQDLYAFNILRQSAYPGSVQPAPRVQARLNNSSASLVYAGNWQTLTNRNLGDFGNDVARSVSTGDSVSITFTGTGVDFLGSRGSFGGNIKVYVDGMDVAAATPNAFTTYSSVAQQQGTLFSVRHLAPATHTVTIVNGGGGALVLDAVQVYGNPFMVNNNDPRISYSAGWGYSGNRPSLAGDFNLDVHYTIAAGATATMTFDGTGVELFGPMDAAQSQARVILNEGSAQQKTVNINAAIPSATYNGMQRYWGISNLPLGRHTIKVIKTGTSGYFQLDAIRVTP